MKRFTGTRTYTSSAGRIAKAEARREARREGGSAKTISTGEHAGAVITTTKEGEIKKVISRTGEDVSKRVKSVDVRKGQIELAPMTREAERMQEQSKEVRIPLGSRPGEKRVDKEKGLYQRKAEARGMKHIPGTFKAAPKGASFSIYQRFKGLYQEFKTTGGILGRERAIAEQEKLVYSGGLLYPIVKGIGQYTGKFRREKEILKGEPIREGLKQKEALKEFERLGEDLGKAETEKEYIKREKTLKDYTSKLKEKGYDITETVDPKDITKSTIEITSPTIKKTKIPLKTRLLGDETNIAMAIGLVGAGARYGSKKFMERLPTKQKIKITDPVSIEIGKITKPEKIVYDTPGGKIEVTTGKKITLRQFETKAQAEITSYKKLSRLKLKKQVSQAEIRSTSLVEQVSPKVSKSVSEFQIKSGKVTRSGKSVGVTEKKGELIYTREKGIIEGKKDPLKFETLSSTYRLKGKVGTERVINLEAKGSRFYKLPSRTPKSSKVSIATKDDLVRFVGRSKIIAKPIKPTKTGKPGKPTTFKSIEEVQYVKFLKTKDTFGSPKDIGIGMRSPTQTITKTQIQAPPITKQAFKQITKSLPIQRVRQVDKFKPFIISKPGRSSPTRTSITMSKTIQKSQQIRQSVTKPTTERPITASKMLGLTGTRTRTSVRPMQIQKQMAITKPATATITTTKPAQITKQKQKQTQRQIQKQFQIAPPTTKFPAISKGFGFIPPIILPKAPQLQLFKSKYKKSPVKAKKGYTATLLGVEYDIKTRKPLKELKKKLYSGIEIRGVKI